MDEKFGNLVHIRLYCRKHFEMSEILIQIIGRSSSGKTSIAHEIADHLREIFEFDVTLIDDDIENPEYPIYNQRSLLAISKKTKIKIKTIQKWQESDQINY